MTRATRPGSIQEVVRAAYRAAGGIESASADLNLSLSVLSYGTEQRDDRPGGLGVNYLDRLGRMEPDAARPIAQHFAQLAGGVFMPLDQTGVTARDINQVTKEFSDVLAQHAAAHSAGSENPDDYTQAEAFVQVQELTELIQAAAAFRTIMIKKAGVK